ncbi:MAG TPA: phosphoribosylformylglycinamidine cyclo-ligase [Armatimonadota bacterium]|nr:phosphoribosylformylglycinamidine cyclo-ligase [Armatimonadota bacterium]
MPSDPPGVDDRPQSRAYAAAGVDIDAAEETIRRFRAAVEATHGPEVLGGIGHFGGLFAPDLSGLEEPVLVSGTDSVGTNIRLAFASGIHHTVGIDAVAMCVNDVLTLGARPLFFLDCLSVGKVQPERDAQVVTGVAEGCRQAECALIGGELAEVAGLLGPDEYDLVGFAVAVVDRKRIIDGSRVRQGDVLIGIASSGLHSNGYSLARKVVFEQAGLGLHDPMPGTGQSVIDAMLEPTLIYTRTVRSLIDAADVRGLAHITGGGLIDNVPRILPTGLRADIDTGSWPTHAVFTFIQQAGGIDDAEMYRVFNMGIGLVAVVREQEAPRAISAAESAGARAFLIGRVAADSGAGPRVVLH